MKTFVVFGALAVAAALQAQDAGPGVQVRNWTTAAFADQFSTVRVMSDEGMPVRTFTMAKQDVTGRPFSGVEVHQSRQELSDGTVISNSSTDRFYRDSAGRTRMEDDAHKRVVIEDPVARVTITLETGSKKARRLSMGPAEASIKFDARAAKPSPMLFTYTIDDSASPADVKVGFAAVASRAAEKSDTAEENLGVESLDGVLATHTRRTLTIPQGQIGNDRDIHVVNERWYSDDLQMIVKTVNSDPRFGENTYELTEISRDEPDASLFQVPADYTVVEAGPRRVLQPATGPGLNK